MGWNNQTNQFNKDPNTNDVVALAQKTWFANVVAEDF